MKRGGKGLLSNCVLVFGWIPFIIVEEKGIEYDSFHSFLGLSPLSKVLWFWHVCEKVAQRQEVSSAFHEGPGVPRLATISLD